MLGVTAIGRATVNLLKTNRDGVIAPLQNPKSQIQNIAIALPLFCLPPTDRRSSVENWL